MGSSYYFSFPICLRHRFYHKWWYKSRSHQL